MYNVLTQFFSAIAGIWMAYVLYLFAIFLVLWCIKFIIFFTPLSDSKYFSILAKCLILFFLLFTLYGVSRARMIKVTPVEVHLRNLPAAWENKKILHISDVHIGWIWGNGRLDKLRSKIIETKPDMVVITGDLFDGSSGVHERFLKGLKALASANPPWGIYFTSGNHERYSGYEKIINVVEKSGINLLENKIVNLDGLLLAGISYPDIAESGNPQPVYDFRGDINYKKDLPLVLLYHVPVEFNYQVKSVAEMQQGSYMKPDTSFKTAREWGVDLQLSGHTHAGQFFPFEFITKKIFNGFHYGLNQIDDFQVYTHAGTGTWGPPVRHAQPGEVALITLKKKRE